MRNIVRYSPLLIASAALVWALGTDPDHVNLGQLQREYERKQAAIDLTMAEIQLKASEGTITAEEAQSQIDEWARANSSLLRAQAERAALLDRMAPLPKDPGMASPPAEEATPLSPAHQRIKELESLQASEISALSTEATSAEDLQLRVDKWARSPTGAAILQEKEALIRQTARLQPIGTQPIILESRDNATPREIEAMDFQENLVRRLQTIRQQHPNATVEEMQILIDADKHYFEENMTEIRSRLAAARGTALADEVQRLKALAGTSPEPKDDKSPPKR